MGIVFLLGSSILFGVGQSAAEIMNKTYQYIGSLNKYAFNAVVTDEERKDGKVVKTYKHKVSVKVHRPNKLRVDTQGDIKNRTVYVNNGVFTMIDHGYDYYGQLKTAKTIDGTLDYIFEKYGIRAPLASLIYSDMYKRVKFNKSKYFGKVKVAGVECDYVAFKSKVREIHIWVTTGDHPLVKAYSIIDINIEGNPRRNALIEWNTHADFLDSDFIFKAPKSATKISIEPAN